MKATIMLSSGETCEIYGQQFGQWIIHPMLSAPGNWTISDLESGTALIGFSQRHVAENFARELDRLYDTRGLARRAIDRASTDYDRWVMSEIIRRGKGHPARVPIPGKSALDHDPTRGR